jgi:hypothetical protein
MGNLTVGQALAQGTCQNISYTKSFQRRLRKAAALE